MHIKVLGGAGVSAVAVDEIAQMQTSERISRQVIVLDRERLKGKTVRWALFYHDAPKGLVICLSTRNGGEGCRLVIFRLDT